MEDETVRRLLAGEEVDGVSIERILSERRDRLDSPLARSRPRPKVCYVSSSKGDCEPNSEHTFVHETTIELTLVGLRVVAPRDSYVLSVHDGINYLVSEPRPATDFAASSPPEIYGSRTRPCAKQTVVVRCGVEPGKIGVLFVVEPYYRE